MRAGRQFITARESQTRAATFPRVVEGVSKRGGRTSGRVVAPGDGGSTGWGATDEGKTDSEGVAGGGMAA